jgi:3-oxoacyl-[acyl-carrier-protein] synthase-3
MDLQIRKLAAEALGVDDSKTIGKYGSLRQHHCRDNPLGLRDVVAQKRLREGDLILLISLGPGYTTGAVLMRWAY